MYSLILEEVYKVFNRSAPTSKLEVRHLLNPINKNNHCTNVIDEIYLVKSTVDDTES